MSVLVDKSRNLVVVTPTESITVEVSKKLIEEMLSHPDFEKGMPSIWDLRETELMHINGNDVKEISGIATQQKDRRGKARIGFVVGSDLAFGLGRMFEMMNATSHLETRVFRDMQLAESWVLDGVISDAS